MKFKDYIERNNYRKRAVRNWMSYVSNNYKDILPYYFKTWIKFTEHIKNRSILLTITEKDIYLVDKIFNNIKKLR